MFKILKLYDGNASPAVASKMLDLIMKGHKAEGGTVAELDVTKDTAWDQLIANKDDKHIWVWHNYKGHSTNPNHRQMMEDIEAIKHRLFGTLVYNTGHVSRDD